MEAFWRLKVLKSCKDLLKPHQNFVETALGFGEVSPPGGAAAAGAVLQRGQSPAQRCDVATCLLHPQHPLEPHTPATLGRNSGDSCAVVSLYYCSLFISSSGHFSAMSHLLLRRPLLPNSLLRATVRTSPPVKNKTKQHNKKNIHQLVRGAEVLSFLRGVSGASSLAPLAGRRRWK